MARLAVGGSDHAGPILVVEVLSPSARTEDTVRKSAGYAATGIAQCWMLDQELRTLTALRNAGGAWEEDVRLDRDHPAAEVSVDAAGTVRLGLEPLVGG